MAAFANTTFSLVFILHSLHVSFMIEFCHFDDDKYAYSNIFSSFFCKNVDFVNFCNKVDLKFIVFITISGGKKTVFLFSNICGKKIQNCKCNDKVKWSKLICNMSEKHSF